MNQLGIQALNFYLSAVTMHSGPVYLNSERHGERATSGDTQRRIDAEVTKMLREAYSRVTALLVCFSHASSQ